MNKKKVTKPKKAIRHEEIRGYRLGKNQFKTRLLRIIVFQAVDLMKRDIFGSCDSYCKITLYKSMHSPKVIDAPFVTRTVKRSLNPEWYEEIIFRTKVGSNRLLFEIFDEHRLTRDSFLGMVTVSIPHANIPMESSERKISPMNYILKPRSSKSTVSGKLCLYLAFIEDESLFNIQSIDIDIDEFLSKDVREYQVAELVTDPTYTESAEVGLPEGWEERVDNNGRTYFVDHNTHTTQWHRPNIPLPEGFEMRTDPSGRVYYVDHKSKVTQWQHPLLSSKLSPKQDGLKSTDPMGGNRRIVTDKDSCLNKFLMNNIMNVTDLTFQTTETNEKLKDEFLNNLGSLPPGWEQRIHKSGRVFYINHNDKKTTWEDPRLEKLAGAKMTYSRNFKQKYDYFHNRFKIPSDHKHKFEMKINRDNLLFDSFRIISNVTKPELLRNKLWIDFIGEKGLDYGGVSREWFYCISRELFNPYYGLFEYSAADNYTLQINPNSGIANANHLDYFKFAGRIGGMAAFHGKLLDAFFIRPFYKMMLCKKITLHDMEAVDSEYYRSLLYILENDPEELDLTFSVTEIKEAETIETELVPGGKTLLVTNENKKLYIEEIIRWRFVSRVESQMESFMQGFDDIIPIHELQIFDANELELLLCGIQDFNVKDWQKFTEYRGEYSSNHPTITNFWMVVYSFDNEMRSRLLQFVTGTSRVPMNGFSQLYGSTGPQRFCIEKWGTVNQFPRAHTCFNRLDLPPYTTYEELRNKLIIAIENMSGFGGVD